jgi:hypothetical protein
MIHDNHRADKASFAPYSNIDGTDRAEIQRHILPWCFYARVMVVLSDRNKYFTCTGRGVFISRKGIV